LNSFYSNEELQELGFAYIGSNVLISHKSSIYGAENISIGDNVRIDDFCILSGKIKLENHIHIAAFAALYGGEKGIVVYDFVNIGSRVSIYSISDDFTGEYMAGPMVKGYRKLTSEEIIIGKHVILGCGCVVLPGAILSEGSVFGAITLVNDISDEWSINVGIPFRKIKNRRKELIKLEEEFLKENY
jgi:galactoside O-acetyltransferase